jgi:proline iminopeptidase
LKKGSGKTVQSRLDYYSKSLPTLDLRPLLNQIETPTLIMCGRFDSQCPLYFSEEIHKLIPKSKFVVFDESNHSPFLEEPEKFTKEIVDFYDECFGKINI